MAINLQYISQSIYFIHLWWPPCYCVFSTYMV